MPILVWMGRIVVKKEFNCKGCNIIIMKPPNQAGIKYWSGYCRSCSGLNRDPILYINLSIKLKNTRTGSDNHNWSEKKLCTDCGKEVRKKGNKTPKRCSKCHLKNGIKKGEKCHLWKGGITEKNHAIRGTKEYKQWAISVKERDNYTCQICKVRGGVLHSDHIKPFCLFPELRFDTNNGRTLCKDCHQKHGWSLFKENNPRKKKILQQ